MMFSCGRLQSLPQDRLSRNLDSFSRHSPTNNVKSARGMKTCVIPASLQLAKPLASIKMRLYSGLSRFTLVLLPWSYCTTYTLMSVSGKCEEAFLWLMFLRFRNSDAVFVYDIICYVTKYQFDILSNRNLLIGLTWCSRLWKSIKDMFCDVMWSIRSTDPRFIRVSFRPTWHLVQTLPRDVQTFLFCWWSRHKNQTGAFQQVSTQQANQESIKMVRSMSWKALNIPPMVAGECTGRLRLAINRRKLEAGQ